MSQLVFHLERLTDCQTPIIVFANWWNGNGPFPITVVPNGGLRDDEETQADLYAKGRTLPGPHAGEPGFPAMGLTVTAARSLHETPHGRGAAMDIMPAVVNHDGSAVVAVLSDVRDAHILALYTDYGLIAEKRGLVWGGRWKRKDYAHVEMTGWRALP